MGRNNGQKRGRQWTYTIVGGKNWKLETNITTKTLIIQLYDDQTWEEKKGKKRSAERTIWRLPPNPSPKRLRRQRKDFTVFRFT